MCPMLWHLKHLRPLTVEALTCCFTSFLDCYLVVSLEVVVDLEPLPLEQVLFG